MSYSPNNVNVYTAAYAGAFAGMVSSGRYLKNASMSAYANRAAYAGAWAQEFDTLWGVNSLDQLQLDSIAAHSSAVWEERTPTPDSSAVVRYTDPSTYSEEIAAIVAAINAEETFFGQQGITPPVYPPTPVSPYLGGYTSKTLVNTGGDSTLDFFFQNDLVQYAPTSPDPDNLNLQPNATVLGTGELSNFTLITGANVSVDNTVTMKIPNGAIGVMWQNPLTGALAPTAVIATPNSVFVWAWDGFTTFFAVSKLP